MKVLDLFAGLRGWSKVAEDRGHEVVSIDFDKRFDVTHHADLNDTRGVLTLLDSWRPDLILASPPCEGFTVMNIGKNWYHDGTPKTDTARGALRLVHATLSLIDWLDPTYFVIENPRGKLRALPVLSHLERRTVTYCQLGEARMKPTDLWGRFPLVLPLPCKNGMTCHVAAPRGSKTPGSTQGIKGAENRAQIPAALALLVIAAAERDLMSGREPTHVNVHAPATLSLWGEL